MDEREIGGGSKSGVGHVTGNSKHSSFVVECFAQLQDPSFVSVVGYSRIASLGLIVHETSPMTDVLDDGRIRSSPPCLRDLSIYLSLS
jgi:hypothetical protein